MTLRDLATAEYAAEYAAAQEQYLYCDYLLTAHDIPNTERNIEALEDLFDEINKAR